MPIPAVASKATARIRLLCAPVWIWIAFALTSVILALVPEIDLSVSRHFFTPGLGFQAKHTTIERLIHASVGLLLVCGNTALIALLFFGRVKNRLNIRLDSKRLLFLLLLLAVGPGLIVNALLKENWGRARPIKIEQFGGEHRFTSAFSLSDQEGKSFSSGHAAASSYWVIAALLIAPGRIWLLRIAVLYSLLVSWMRLAAGAHFLSDIVISYFIMAFLTLALYEVFFRRHHFGATITQQWERELRRFAPPLKTHIRNSVKHYGITAFRGRRGK